MFLLWARKMVSGDNLLELRMRSCRHYEKYAIGSMPSDTKQGRGPVAKKGLYMGKELLIKLIKTVIAECW